jgi:hypothetical protein
MCYLLLLVYSQVRYVWLWRSLLQLFRQIALLPMAGAFERIPPRVAAKFGRFLRSSLNDDIDLEIPLQQCHLVIEREPPNATGRPPLKEAIGAETTGVSTQLDSERLEIVSSACVRPVLELAWPGRSLEQAYGGSVAQDGSKTLSVDQTSVAGDTLDPAMTRWLAAAEDLLALRVVYLVSQFSGPLRCMSSQLIYGPILLLLAVAWYPFHPLRLLTIVIWAFVIIGVMSTLIVLVQIERSDLVTRVARTTPNSFKFDQSLVSNLLPYAVPLVGFLLTAFPSLGYWLGSLLEPIGRAVK